MNTISSTYCLLNCLFTCFFIKSQRLKYLAVTLYSSFINGALKNIALRTVNILLFVCLFIRSCSSHSRIFPSFGDVTIPDEGLQILTYARHFWPSSSGGSLACHTYRDTEHPFIMVISEDTLHSHLPPSVWQWICRFMFLRLMSVAIGIRTPNPPLAGWTLQPTAPPPRRKYTGIDKKQCLH